jgi:membrane protease YdiL (CAAX protease family)
VSERTKPWGIFATLALGTLALLGGQLAGIGAITGLGLDLSKVETINREGNAFVLLICVSAPVQVALLVAAAGLRGNPAVYLGYTLPRRSELLVAIAGLAALIVLGDAASLLAGRNVVDRFQSDIYEASNSVNLFPLLLFAITVLIPIGEESLFRGFLFRGWLTSPNRAWPVILITAALFAVIHVQYDWFLIAQVFAFGVYFGWIRWATGSTILTMVLHGLVNLEGMIETLLSAGS